MNEELRLAAAAAAAALSTDGVHSMGAGRYVEDATYGAGEKVLGVVMRPGEVEVHVVADVRRGEAMGTVKSNLQENVRQHLAQSGVPSSGLKVRVNEADPRQSRARVR
ncbi:MAG: hypothetical protein WKF53_16950 [Rubrobacter sp.]